MPNIKYPHIIGNRPLVVKLLFEMGMSVDDAARTAQVPYNCFLNQCKRLLSEEEYAQISRKRKKFSLREKIEIVKFAKSTGITEAVKEFDVAPVQIRNFVVQLRQLQAARQAAKT